MYVELETNEANYRRNGMPSNRHTACVFSQQHERLSFQNAQFLRSSC